MKSLKYLLSLSFILIGVMAYTQPPPPPASPAVPIDAGLGLLLAGGVAYGIKKISDSRKN